MVARDQGTDMVKSSSLLSLPILFPEASRRVTFTLQLGWVVVLTGFQLLYVVSVPEMVAIRSHVVPLSTE